MRGLSCSWTQAHLCGTASDDDEEEGMARKLLVPLMKSQHEVHACEAGHAPASHSPYVLARTDASGLLCSWTQARL